MAKFYTPSKLSENIRETPEGFLFCLDVGIARTGYQTYGEGETPLECDDNGEVEIYRSPEEVFRPQTIASFQGKSVTIRHPEDFVGPDNWSILSKGAAHNVRKAKEKDENGEEVLLADLLVTDAQAIQLVKAGLREVSCGYEAEYEQTGKGKGRQINIIGNHIALVEQGRAGEQYAINDHKGKGLMSAKLIEKFKARFGAKVIDEVMAEEKKESKDEGGEMMDELVKAVKDLGEKVDSMSKEKSAKDEDEKDKPKDKPKDEKEEKSEDDDGEMEMEERLKALEAAVSKILEKMGAKDEDESEDEEEKDKPAKDEDEESEDDEEDPAMTGDSARAEILSPGVVKTAKKEELKVKALSGAYSTKDGKSVLESLVGDKAAFAKALKSKKTVDTLFIAASEVLKHRRGTGLEKTKDGSRFEIGDSKSEPMTADKMNELNAAHWAGK